MAASLTRFGSLVLRHTCRIPSRRKVSPPATSSFRTLLTTPTRQKNKASRSNTFKSDDDDVDLEPKKKTSRSKDFEFDDDYLEPGGEASSSKEFKFDYSDLGPEDKAEYDSLSPEEKIEYQKAAADIDALMRSPEVESELNAEVAQLAAEVAQEAPSESTAGPNPIKPGLMALGELDQQGTGEDEVFKGDDISSLAHGELEQHREIREMARIAAWEMPLLSKLVKPFEPPTLDQPLRFRYTTYMGETHPAANKIVLQFCTADLPLTPAQRTKLIKLVGVRYNPQTDLVKMSSEMFETQAQNKRYLGDLVDTLMAEAKDEKDMFEDIPLDFRHHKFKRKPEFPEAWKRTNSKLEAKQPARISST